MWPAAQCARESLSYTRIRRTTGKMKYKRRLWTAFLVPFVGMSAPAPYSVDQVVATSGNIRSGSIALPRMSSGCNYTLLFSVVSPSSMSADSRLEVTLSDGTRTLAAKTLHAGDPDLYAPFHMARSAAPELRLVAKGVAGRYRIQINQWPESGALMRGGNHSWKEASPITLGQTVFASADGAQYIPVAESARKDAVNSAPGEDWYRFTFD